MSGVLLCVGVVLCVGGYCVGELVSGGISVCEGYKCE